MLMFRYLLLVCCLAGAYADYDCICSYATEAKIYDAPKVSAKVLGYMYEFDCKPGYNAASAVPGWLIVASEHRVGYIENGTTVEVQRCQGSVPYDDKVTTILTQAPTTRTSTTTSTKTTKTIPKTKITTSTTTPTTTTAKTTLRPTTTTTATTQRATTTTTTLKPTVTTTTTTLRPTTTTTTPRPTSTTTTITPKPTTTTTTTTPRPTTITTTTTPKPTTTTTTTTQRPTTTPTTPKPTTTTTTTTQRPTTTTTTPRPTTTTTTPRPTTTTTTTTPKPTTTTTTTTPRPTTTTTTTTPKPTTTTTATTPRPTTTTTTTTPRPTTTTTTTTPRPTTTTTTTTPRPTTIYIQHCPTSVTTRTQLSYIYKHMSYCYEFRDHLQDWYHASADCHNNGGFLLSIHSQDEQDFVLAMLNRLRRVHPIWLGLNDEVREEHWQWASGTPLKYTNWMPDRLHDKYHSFEDCGLYVPLRKGQWDDVHCKGELFSVPATHPWICQYNLV